MDTNTNDYILVLEDKESKKLSVVSSVDAEGKVQTIEPLDAHSGQFMKFSENDSIFKNFMENFTRQFNDPSRTGLYRLVADKVESSVMILQEMLQQPQENEEQLKLMRMNLEDYAPKEQLGRVNEERIDWNELTAIGITREQLKASGNLEKMLGWGKSNLMPIAVPFGDKTIYTEARLAFREDTDGNLALAIHTIRKEPRLDFPFMGVEFSEEDKKMLRETGNLGRLADVTPKNGETFKAFISVDSQTNELIALRADRVRVPDEIKGVKLSEQQKSDLAMGKAVAVENMISKAGKPFNAQIQINADKKGIEFKFDNTPRQSVTQHVNQEQQKGVSRKICGVELTEKQQAALQVCVVDKDEELTGLNEASESVKYTDQEIPYEVESSKDVKILEDGFKVSRNGGSITLKFDGLDESETYLIVEDMDYQSEKQELEEAAAVNLNIEYENNKKTIHYMTDKNNFYCGVKDFLANMGYHRGGGKEMTISFQKAGTYTFSDFRIVCQPVKDFSEMTAACKQKGLSDVTFEGNSMTGTITNEESQMLCITIPYCEGWTAYVDGEETNLYQINTLYSGIYLTPGKHTVQMTYHTPFLCEGVWISLCSLLIFAGIMRQYNMKKKKLEYV